MSENTHDWQWLAGRLSAALMAYRGRAGLALPGALAIVLLLAGSATTVQSSSAGAAQQHCYVSEVPCLGRVQALYAFEGKAGGALHLIHAKLGPEEEVGKTSEGIPIVRRTFTWTSAASVKLVAAFVLSSFSEHGKAVPVRGKYRWTTQRIATGTHSGRATLTSSATPSSGLRPFLLLEGRNVPAARSSAHQPTAKCVVEIRGFVAPRAPCRGPLQTLYSFDGFSGGNTGYIKAKPGPITKVGKKYYSSPTPEEVEVTKRTFTWHSIAKVKIVAAYIAITFVGSPTKYQEVPTGPHSGHASMINIQHHSSPGLLLEGVKEETATTPSRKGASCKHPLEITKSSSTHGDTGYLSASLQQ